MTLARLVLALAAVAPASAQAIHVDDTATGANDGTSWQDAFTDLQSALRVATPQSEIWVARGTYVPTSTLDRGAEFVVECAVYGGFDGTETTLAGRAGCFDQTILSGDLLGDDGPDFAGNDENSLHVVYVPDLWMPRVVLDGFTVRGGNANAGPIPFGGGMLVHYWANSVVVRNCTFTANHAVYGGAIGSAGKPVLTIKRCTFAGNRAQLSGGGAYPGTNTVVQSCTFLGNSAGTDGGGVIWANWVADCIFSGNVAGGRGGGTASTYQAWNCTFTGNTARLGGGVWADVPSYHDLVNCVLWENADASGSTQSGQVAGAPTVTASIVQGWDGSIPGADTIDADPLFRSPRGADGIAGTLDDDVGVEAGSPCIDTGRSSGYFGLGVDALGRPRFVDALACDAGGVLDRGAVERGHIDGDTTFCDPTPSSLGVPAVLRAPCTVLLSGGAFQVAAHPLPVSSRVPLLLIGAPGTPQTFGDGFLCLSGRIRRITAADSSGSGAVFLVDPSALAPGATAGFQALFSDPASAGAGYNLSSAVRILALP